MVVASLRGQTTNILQQHHFNPSRSFTCNHFALCRHHPLHATEGQLLGNCANVRNWPILAVGILCLNGMNVLVSSRGSRNKFNQLGRANICDLTNWNLHVISLVKNYSLLGGLPVNEV